jgi:CheY-like chemotaxis protein
VQKYVILFVDDEEIVRRIAMLVLERDGYTVLIAKNGHEAIEIGATHPGPIHLVLTDMRMPGMNGMEVRRRMLEHRPDTVVAVLSGDTYGGESRMTFLKFRSRSPLHNCGSEFAVCSDRRSGTALAVCATIKQHQPLTY